MGEASIRAARAIFLMISPPDTITHFKQWRSFARTLLAAQIPPDEVHWQSRDQQNLFGRELVNELSEVKTTEHKVPKAFLELAKTAACYRSDERWALLYRILWRLTHGEPHLLAIASDDDICKITMMAKEVRRDSHKMKAFVRFRQVEENDNTYIAWHQPSHFTLERTAPFFVRRFTTMNWAILTPDCCAYWNQESLSFGVGLPRSAAPSNDEVESLWKTFYRNIFNPARIKTAMMKSEMPMKFWHTLPETELIPDMLNSASARVEEMIQLQQSSLQDETTALTPHSSFSKADEP